MRDGILTCYSRLSVYQRKAGSSGTSGGSGTSAAGRTDAFSLAGTILSMCVLGLLVI